MAKGKKTGGRRKIGLSTYSLRLTGTPAEVTEVRRILNERATFEGIPMSRAVVNLLLQGAKRA